MPLIQVSQVLASLSVLLLKYLVKKKKVCFGSFSNFSVHSWVSSRAPSVQFSSVQSLSRVRLFATPWITAHQASLSITNSRSSLRRTSIESVMPSSHLILCCPLLLPPIPPSIRVFSNESTLRMRWPKYWSFSFSFIPSKEIPGLISFRMDCLDLLAVQLLCYSFCHVPALLLRILPWLMLSLSRCWAWCEVIFLCQLIGNYSCSGAYVCLLHWSKCRNRQAVSLLTRTPGRSFHAFWSLSSFPRSQAKEHSPIIPDPSWFPQGQAHGHAFPPEADSTVAVVVHLGFPVLVSGCWPSPGQSLTSRLSGAHSFPWLWLPVATSSHLTQVGQNDWNWC